MGAPPVPQSVLRASRDEVTSIALPLIDGAWPDGLSGHLFVVAPVSTVQYGGRPRPSQPSLLNGDGLVCRLDLGGGRALATSRILRPPCQLADELTHETPHLLPLRFFDAGIARMSPLLGARNFLNTAFVPLCRAGTPPRLLCTYDAGRPFEIDPVTLQVVTPMGADSEWRAEAFDGQPFPLILSPGHPMNDPSTGELFTINYGRSLASMGGAEGLRRLPRPLLRVIAGTLGVGRAIRLERALAGGLRRLDAALARGATGMPQDFTHLVRWDGRGAVQHWRLVLPDGSPVRIRQSVHQVAVTREHVVFMDTAFRVGFEQWFNDPLPSEPWLQQLLRTLLARPQMPETPLYLVRRDALVNGGGPKDPPTVVARQVTIPVESGHLLADYDDADGQITVHLAHNPATDLAEWIRPYDRNFYDGESPPAELHGMLAVGAMDVNRLGRYVIDAARAEVVSGKSVHDDRLTWAVALFAGRGLPATDVVPDRLRQLYWTTEGFFPSLLTRFVHDLYARYPHRLTPLDEIRRLGESGRPSCLVRLDTTRMEIADAHEMPAGTILGSPQFVPRAAGDTDGFVVAVAYTPARMEVWIYDAARLSDGPRCRLDGAALGFGFALHTAWLPAIAARTAGYQIDVTGELAARLPAPARDLLLARIHRR